MKISIIREKKAKQEITVSNMSLEDFLERIKTDTRDEYILQYREDFDTFEGIGTWKYLDRIPMVCFASELKKEDGRKEWKAYNGITELTITGLNNRMEVEKAKNQVAIMPQTLCAFMSADGHGVHVLSKATLPDGSLPKEKELAELFCAQAYSTSVLCYTPNVEFDIKIEEPSLDKLYLMTQDDAPYINPHPTAFIIEQPTRQSINVLANRTEASNRLERLRPSAEAFVTFTHKFNAVYHRVVENVIATYHKAEPMRIIPRVAEACAKAGLPEEEVVGRLQMYFFKIDVEAIRGTVDNIYLTVQEKELFGITGTLSKHQYVAFRLREFLKRRYDIRYNEVLCMTEYRVRRSLHFTYQELGNRELNTIHHEALIEGIEATFGEVDKLVNSTKVSMFNPIEEFIADIPQWDGKDRMKELAAMVPTNHPHWERLFCRWFLSMVAHWMNCDSTYANATAPILIGAQGYRKSTFCKLLLPPELQNFFTDSIDFRTNIEAERSLSRFLLVNIDEFDQLNEKQFAFVKHLFQKPATNIRRMYSETIGTQRRYASFIGTSNQHEVLRDPTGNRRYICAEVTAPIHTEQPINYAQLYAQAKHLIIKGERYWINDEDEALIREYNSRFEVENPLEQLFYTLFSIPAEDDKDGVWMRPTEILAELQTLPTFNRKTDNNVRSLGRVLTKLKLRKERSQSGYVYWVRRV